MKSGKVVLLFLFLFISDSLSANELLNIRIGLHPEKSRIVLDLAEEAQFTTLKTGAADHYELILQNTTSSDKFLKQQKGKGVISSYEIKRGRENSLIVCIESNHALDIDKVFALTKKGKQPYRLVIDVKEKDQKLSAWQKKVKEERESSNEIILPQLKPASSKPSSSIIQDSSAAPLPEIKPIKRVVVIDAGHGGQDPGTVSPKGTKEKDVTLAVALELKKALNKVGKYEVVLTRSKDDYIPLRQRFAIAREHQAHLFISLHADSNIDPKVQGLAIYTLSETASDKEAERLASKENAADFISDLTFAQWNEPDVKNILIDLSQTKTHNLSLDFCDKLMKRFSKSEVLSKNTKRSADFAVLKAPDVASVLIELGYLTNPRDQKRLVTQKYQATIASRIANAIDDYFEHLKT